MTTLVPVDAVKTALIYHLQDLDGAMGHPFVAEEVLPHLLTAAELVRENAEIGRPVELLIWDAYRTQGTQHAIYDRYARELMVSEDVDYERAWELAAAYITPPGGYHPHGTGGALDVSLLIDGKPAYMGTGFDEFSVRSHADWYRHNPPETEQEREAARNREVLRSAMEAAGFVVLAKEWWHFEWGTDRWAGPKGEPVVLRDMQAKPLVTDSATATLTLPARQPVRHAGVAHVFSDPLRRAAALAGQAPGHLYARFSNPTVLALCEFIRRDSAPARHAMATTSGSSACVATFQGLVPKGGTVVYDRYVYYEVERALMALGDSLEWTIQAVDFADLRAVTEACEQLTATGRNVDLLFCDSPRNWWLECLDVAGLAEIGRGFGAKLAVDSSVQPVQDLMPLGADVVILSLSKYASLGMALGGMVLTDDDELRAKIFAAVVDRLVMLSADAAMTIWTQAVSLRDRMTALSDKAERIATHLATRADITAVRVADAKQCGFAGGQVVFHAASPDVAHTAERLVGHNSLRVRSGLHLACTYGSAMTTYEHFASNTRHRTGIAWDATNEALLTDDMVRIGVGCEPVEDIIADLDMVLNCAYDVLRPGAPRP
ncbi:PLP-dependent transferase [Lentzea sp. JNUCC 0626]|uniref:PLP-dependent transferase n=1 Tax=Lentzea sp. JNUCC 0626 TaxID=3367513 RepID=UPI0037491D76